MGGEYQFEADPLYRIEKFMASMTDLDGLLVIIMREATVATDTESCSLALYDENTDELYFYVARGGKEEREFERKLRFIRMKMGSGVVGWCAVNRKIVKINDAYNDPRFNREADRQTGFVTRSILAVPMLRRGKLIGVVEAVNKRARDGFSERDEKVLTALAAQAALVIENARLYEENIQRTRLSALGQGITGAAHCIKNILTGIDGGSYILERGIQRHNMESIAQGWDILKRNTQIMRGLALDMLTYSRPRDPEYEASDINEICTGVAQMMRGKAREKNVEVSLDLHPDIDKVTLDPKDLSLHSQPCRQRY
jgi:signal transduction protein with GAF and PtsI domain